MCTRAALGRPGATLIRRRREPAWRRACAARGPARGSRGGACAGTNLEPSLGNLRAVNAATVCLLNVERSARRLSPLRANVTLARASLRHARDMAANDYFSHESRSGDEVLARVRREGYLRGSERWVVGENLAFGKASQTAPKAVVEAWMKSPGHRSNILYRGFEEVGIGIALGVPESGEAEGATYTTGFGAR